MSKLDPEEYPEIIYIGSGSYSIELFSDPEFTLREEVANGRQLLASSGIEKEIAVRNQALLSYLKIIENKDRFELELTGEEIGYSLKLSGQVLELSDGEIGYSLRPLNETSHNHLLQIIRVDEGVRTVSTNFVKNQQETKVAGVFSLDDYVKLVYEEHRKGILPLLDYAVISLLATDKPLRYVKEVINAQELFLM